ncbi:MAG: AraC family transcriptional regulator [Pseudomonadales bacterium]|nr:AraC family transcriptional regulator [Pseudomonadales bacterium]
MQDFTRASSLFGYHELALQLGLDTEALLTAAELPENVLEQLDGLIPYSRFLRLLDLSTVKSGDRFFGLKLGLHQGISIFGPLLYLIRNAPNVGDALNELRQYFHMHMGGASVVMEQHRTTMQLSYHIHNTQHIGIVQGTELAIGVGQRLLQALCGESWALRAVLFEHSPHSAVKDYQRLLNITPQFNSSANAIVFDANLLHHPLNEADPTLHALIREHLYNVDQLTNQELPDFVASLLRNLLDTGQITINDVTPYLAMSRRTLQRKLAACGTSFQKVLDETRQNLAQRYLRDSSLQMTQLADLLGYGDLSAFSRAFTRWFGVPPSEWRMINKH